LHRETVGDFESAKMLDMSTIEALAEQGLQRLRDKLLPADVALADFPAVSLGAEDAQRFCGGQGAKGFWVWASCSKRAYWHHEECF
jgi:tRNA U55 pseudouridine synthase TruB